MSDSFTAASGSWDTNGNWPDGIPTNNSSGVTIGAAATLVTAAGTDAFSGLQLNGATAGGAATRWTSPAR